MKMKDMDKVRVTGFYGHLELNRRGLSWDLIRSNGSQVKEEWVIGGDFNEILDDSGKSEG